MSRPKTKWVVCGYHDGRHISVPGFDDRLDAQLYAGRKGWSDIIVIRDCEFTGA